MTNSKNITMNAAVINFVVNYCGEDKLDKSDEGAKSELPNKVINTRLTESEWRALEKILEGEGVNIYQWLLSLVRSKLTDEPQFNKSQILDLQESNRQLLAIGRNLNQLVRAINTENLSTKAFTEKYASDILDRVYENMDAINNLVQGSTNRDLK